ncbi:DUF1318 domain-containing protein [candidate division KSB1 bacterium]|nr:DUF1318 domain-containing protein [candidate division KSB1 bacterium]
MSACSHIMNRKANFILLIFMVFIAGCSVEAPEVKITGEKTALENQVIGTYEEIEQDSWTITSVRSTSPGKAPAMSEEKKKVLSAVQNRRFNKDDIDEFKEDMVVGENNNGFLEIRNAEKLNKDADYRKRVEQIVAAENQDRKVIMERAMQVNEDIAKAGAERVASVFAKIWQEESAPGTLIQLEDGSWVKKGSD